MSARVNARVRARRPKAVGPVISAVVLSVLIAMFGVIAAWPIYQTTTLWVVGVVGALLACATVVLVDDDDGAVRYHF